MFIFLHIFLTISLLQLIPHKLILLFLTQNKVPHFQVDVWFCSDKKISELNGEWREKDSSTDILSFPANDFESPGVFADDPSLEFQKHLGDLVLAPNYIMKQCYLDEEDYKVNMTVYVLFINNFVLSSIFYLFIF